MAKQGDKFPSIIFVKLERDSDGDPWLNAEEKPEDLVENGETARIAAYELKREYVGRTVTVLEEPAQGNQS